MDYQTQIKHNMMGVFLQNSITDALHQHLVHNETQWFYPQHQGINGLSLYNIILTYGTINRKQQQEEAVPSQP